MNTKSIALLTLATALLWLLSGCVLQDKCEEDVTYIHMEPVYMDMADLRTLVGPEAARPLENPGKIYVKDQYVLINEVNEGVHVIDNLDPSNPTNVAFIRIPGAHDMAVKGTYLYVDSYVDMVTLDISDPTNAREVNRQENVIPHGSWHPGLEADPSRGIAVRFEEQRVTETVPCDNWRNMPQQWGMQNTFVERDDNTTMAFDMSGAASPMSGEVPNGIGGSMARFTLVNDYLYMVNTSELVTYSVGDLDNPQLTSRQEIASWTLVETVFPMQNHLLIGSMNGMFIYSLSDPANPTYLSEMQHMTSCDPVVAEGDYAFVTLRNGNDCGNAVNQLDVVNISDMSSPWLVRSYEMFNPHGLGISEGTLFICDGDAGLKIYDASEINAIDRNQLAHFPDIHAYDVIPLVDVLLLIGEDGFYQYDYSDLNDIRLLSSIPVPVQ